MSNRKRIDHEIYGNPIEDDHTNGYLNGVEGSQRVDIYRTTRYTVENGITVVERTYQNHSTSFLGPDGTFDTFHHDPHFELNYNDLLNDDGDYRPTQANNHHRNRGFGCFYKGLLDGFTGDEPKHVGKHIRERCGGRGGRGMSNCLNNHKFEDMVRDRIRNAEHHFGHIHPDTGRIIGAVNGNDFFNFGGLHNNLTDTGKIILDNIMKRKCKKRKVHKFIRPFAPHPPAGKTQEVKESEDDAKPADPTPEEPSEPSAPKSEPKAAATDVTAYGLDFEQEREKCLQSKTLFEDPEFPANDKSLYYRYPPQDRVEWKRPGEIVQNPQLLVGGESRFDVEQGQLGDCWFLAAVANLTLHDALFYRVVPPDQSFTENYAGIFHFQFWHYGKWVDVVIDDRLPTVDGQLYYMHSGQNNEFWSALLEKAYAKLYGTYEHLDGGTTAEALEDFTGGLTEYFDLRKVDKTTVLAALVKGMEMGSLFACSIDADANIKENQLSNGLICGHAYSVTSIHNVNYRGESLTLLRLRNPWGNSKEWKGAWSDNSDEWNQIDEQTKKDMGVKFAADGEFWISADDFYNNYTQLECCNLSADVFEEIQEITGVDVKSSRAEDEKSWKEQSKDGAWSTAKGTAGGCNNYPDTYYRNPQFGTVFQAPKESVENDGKVTVIVSVLQKYRRELRSQGKDMLPIGVSVYQITSSLASLGADFFNQNRPVARTAVFINMREVTAQFRVPPGNYVAVPCTFEPDSDGEFLLRAFANAELEVNLLK